MNAAFCFSEEAAWDGDTDWTALRKADYPGIMLRAYLGQYKDDPPAQERTRLAIRSRMVIVWPESLHTPANTAASRMVRSASRASPRRRSTSTAAGRVCTSPLSASARSSLARAAK